METDRRFARERNTIRAMLGIYCRDMHRRRGGLCGECAELFSYAEQRLDKCLFPDNKPTCAACPVHCYKPAMRTRVKDVMRYAGPRMLFRHPYLAILHMIDARKKGPLVRRRPGGAANEPGPTGQEAVPQADGLCCAEPAGEPPGAGRSGGAR